MSGMNWSKPREEVWVGVFQGEHESWHGSGAGSYQYGWNMVYI